jgi:hypothetical protein
LDVDASEPQLGTVGNLPTASERTVQIDEIGRDLGVGCSKLASRSAYDLNLGRNKWSVVR